MFDLGMSELLVIGIVALIVIGPKDLPGMFATLGRFTAKARAMSREFSRAMEAAAKESGVNDVARDLKAATSAKSMGLDAVKDAAAKFEKWDPLKPQTRPAAAAPVAAASEPPNVALGPATKALAEKQAEQRIQSAAKAAELRAAAAGTKVVSAAEPPVAAATVRGGRVRSKVVGASEAPLAIKAAVAKPAVAKPAAAKPAAAKPAATKPKSPKADA